MLSRVLRWSAFLDHNLIFSSLSSSQSCRSSPVYNNMGSDQLISCLRGDNHRKTRQGEIWVCSAVMFNMWPDGLLHGELHSSSHSSLSLIIRAFEMVDDMRHHVELICDLTAWNINRQARGLLSVSVYSNEQPPEGEWWSIKAMINAIPLHWGSSIDVCEHKTLPLRAGPQF